MKKVITLLTIFLLFLLTACPLPGSYEYEMIEQQEKFELYAFSGEIINFPTWFGNSQTGINSYSVSEWKPWDSDEAKTLKEFIGTNIKAEGFNGNYQLIIEGMSFYILFDDEISKRNIFYNYIPLFDSFKTWGTVYISQKKSDEYYYSAFVRRSFFENIEGSNLIKLIQNYVYKAEFNYLLNIGGNEVINEKFTTYKPYSVEVYIPDWLRYKAFSVYKSTVYGQKFYGFDFEEDSKGFPYLSYIMQLESETENSVIYSFEGISPNQPKYLKIENLGDTEFLFSWYKDLNSEPVETSTQKGTGAF